MVLTLNLYKLKLNLSNLGDTCIAVLLCFPPTHTVSLAPVLLPGINKRIKLKYFGILLQIGRLLPVRVPHGIQRFKKDLFLEKQATYLFMSDLQLLVPHCTPVVGTVLHHHVHHLVLNHQVHCVTYLGQRVDTALIPPRVHDVSLINNQRPVISIDLRSVKYV